jgi:hypothetical protein
VHEVNVHKTYKGIPSLRQLTLLVLAEPMKAAAIKTAEIYGVAMLTGVAALPISVAATFLGKDSVREVIDVQSVQLYDISLAVVKRMGTITRHDPVQGVIKANIRGAMVALELRKKKSNKTEITISARKYMLPKLDIAGGVLYQILDKLR